jgi:hypothetical protein
MPECTFCPRPAIDGGYIQPAMCTKHHSLAILISMLKSRGQPATLDNINALAAYFHRARLDPDEIPALLAPMMLEAPILIPKGTTDHA